METYTVLGPAAYASYFINGDASGLDDNEIIQADLWYAANVNNAYIATCSEEPFFSSALEAWAHTPYRSGDVLEYTVMAYPD